MHDFKQMSVCGRLLPCTASPYSTYVLNAQSIFERAFESIRFILERL